MSSVRGLKESPHSAIVLPETLADGVVFDGRNLYEPDTVEHKGLQYYAIGRGRA